MSITYFPQLQSGIITQRPYTTEAAFLHATNDLDCGVRYSYSYRTNPLSKFTVNCPSITDAEVTTLENFFNSMNGRYGQFAFLDPVGNLVPNSESFSGGAYDPYQGNRAGYASYLSAQVLPSDGYGITLCTSVWVQAYAGAVFNIGFTGSTGNVTVSSGRWTRIWWSGTVQTSGAVYATVSGPGCTMFGFQCVPLPGPGAYAKTPGSGYGYHPNCRFDTDDFVVRYVGPNQNSVTLPIVEIGF